MHEMLEACCPVVEVMTRSGDVDDSANQVQLTGLVPCSHFYTRGWRLLGGGGSYTHACTGYPPRRQWIYQIYPLSIGQSF